MKRRLGYGGLGGAIIATSLVGVAFMGCSEQSNSKPGGGVQSSVSAGITAPRGPFPRGQATGNFAPDPATTGPEITLVSPDRSAQVTGQSIEVRLKADDPNGVSGVWIGGTAAVQAGAEYASVITLQPGVNIVQIEAEDTLGNRTNSYVDLVSGTFQPDTEFMKESVAVSLTKPGLDRVADIAQQQTASLDLWSLLAGGGPLMDTTLIKIDALGLTHDPLMFRADGAPTGIEVAVDLDNLILELDVDAIGLNLTRAIVTADRTTITARARISQTAFTGTGTGKRALGLEVEQVDIDLTNFKLKTTSGVLNVVLMPFQGMIRGAVEKAIRGVIMDTVDDQLSQSLVALDVPAPISIPNPMGVGPPIDLGIQMEINESSGGQGVGVGLVAGVKVEATTPMPTAQRQVLVSGTRLQPQVLGPERFGVLLTSDALNGVLHAIYAGGALSVELDGTQPTSGSSIQMNAGLLYPFLPPIRDLAPDPNTPIVIEASLGSAPVTSIGQDPTRPLKATIGQAQVRLLIDYMDGGPRLEVFTLNVAAQVAANIMIQNNQIVISNLEIKHSRVDVVNEPVVDLADQELEDFIHAMIPSISAQYLAQLPAIDIPGLPLGLALTNVRIDVTPNTLAVFGDL